MSITVSDLLIRVRADMDQAKAGLAEVSGSLGGMSAIGLAAGVGIAAGVAVAGVALAKMAGDFQSGMTTLVTGAGEAEANLGMVSKGILQMAVDTGTTTAQLTAGMFMIESAGFHGAAGLRILQAAAEGAKVGNADLGTVADATTTILKDFANTGITANQAVNALITTVASGKTHMQDLAQSLALVAPTAAAAGVSLEDMLAAMATMTGEGVPAANAATYLRQAIIALEAPGGKATKMLKEIGLTTADVAGAMKESLPDALKMITDHLKTKFPEGSAAYVAAIKDIAGGSKQMQAFLDLTGQHMDEFGANALKLGHDVYFGKDAIAGWNLTQQDFNFKIDKAKEVVETLGIKIGTALLPVLGNLLSAFTGILPGAIATVTGWLNKAGDAVRYVQTHMDTMSPLVAAVAAAIGTLLVGAFVALAGAAWGAAAGVIAATWPILAIAAAVAALAAGLVWAYNNVQTFHDAMDKLKPVVQAVGDLFQPMASKAKIQSAQMQVDVTGNAQKMAKDTVAALDKQRLGILDQLKRTHDEGTRIALQFKLGVVTHHEQMAKQSVANAKHLHDHALQHLSDMKKTGIQHVMEMAGGIISTIAGMAKQFMGHIGDIIRKVGEFMGHIGELRDNLAQRLQPAIHNVSEKLAELHAWFHDKLLPILKKLYDFFMTNILPVLQQVGGFIRDQVVANLKNMWSFIQNPLLPILGNLADFIKTGVGKQFKAFGAAVDGTTGLIGTLIGKIGDLLGLLGNLRDALSKIHPPNLGDFHIPGFASGTDDAPGGIAKVHKDEYIFLPQHSRVIPAAQTSALFGGSRGGAPSFSSGGMPGGDIVVHAHWNVDGRQVAESVVRAARLATGQRQ